MLPLALPQRSYLDPTVDSPTPVRNDYIIAPIFDWESPRISYSRQFRSGNLCIQSLGRSFSAKRLIPKEIFRCDGCFPRMCHVKNNHGLRNATIPRLSSNLSASISAVQHLALVLCPDPTRLFQTSTNRIPKSYPSIQSTYEHCPSCGKTWYLMRKIRYQRWLKILSEWWKVN